MKEAQWARGNTMSAPFLAGTGSANPSTSSSSESTTSLGLLTESRLKTFRRCHREHLIRYQLLIHPRSDSEALRFGSLVHAALEAWWRAASDRLAAALSAIAGEEADDFERVKADEMLRGYDARWGAYAEQVEIIGVELEFRTPLRNPMTGRLSRSFELAGKIDVLVRETETGRVVMIEHKTSGVDIGPGSTYWARLKLDGQISMYFKGAESLGYKADACLYDVLGKPKIKPHKATPVESRKYKSDGSLYANQREADETPEEYRERLTCEIADNPDRYYQRGEVVRLERETADFEWELWNTALLMRDAQREQRAPRNPDGCERYGRMCSYFAVCTGEASLEDPALFEQLDWAHPELEQA